MRHAARLVPDRGGLRVAALILGERGLMRRWMRRAAAPSVFGVACAISMGCGEASAAVEGSCARPEAFECGDGVFCPSGTACVRDSEADASAPRCRVGAGGSDSHALILGFNVSELPLARGAGAAGRFEVRVPSNVDLIHCVLFICP